jgi:ribose transport system substrate-binding protein
MKKAMAMPAVLLVAVLAGCGSSNTSTTSKNSASKGGPGAKVSYLSPVAAEPDQQQINAGLERAAKELGWTETVLDSALSSSKQVSNVETAINEGDNAMASWTLEPIAAAGAYEKAQAAGVPVVGMNSAGKGVSATVWWEVQRCEPGGPQAKAAAFIAKRIPNAKTLMIGFDEAESTRELSSCFAKEAKAAGLDVIRQANNPSDTSAGSETVVAPLLTKYPEVQAVWDYNDESALGASAALTAIGKKIASSTGTGGVVVIGSNGDADAIEAIRQGRLTLTWDPNNVATGYGAIKEMEAVLKAGKGAKVPSLTIKTEMVDASNVASYVSPLDRHYTLGDLPLVK